MKKIPVSILNRDILNRKSEWESLKPLSEKGGKEFFEKYVNELYEESEKARFIQNPLASAFFQQYQADDEEMGIALNLNRTKEFYQYLYWKTIHREPINISIFGVQRGGKSGVGMNLGLIHSRLNGIKFPVNGERIFKNQNAFLRSLPESKDNFLYIIDEQKVGHSQIGAWATEWELTDFNFITAKRCVSQIWISPEMTDRGGEYSLKVLGLDRKRQMSKCLIFDLRNSEDECFKIFGWVAVRHYDKTINDISPELLTGNKEKKINAIPVSSLRYPALLRKNYEEKKDKQIQEISIRYQNDRNLYRLETALELTKDDLFAIAKNSIERKVVARTLLPDSLVEEEIDEIIKLATNPEFLISLIERVKKGKVRKKEDDRNK